MKRKSKLVVLLRVGEIIVHEMRDLNIYLDILENKNFRQ